MTPNANYSLQSPGNAYTLNTLQEYYELSKKISPYRNPIENLWSTLDRKLEHKFPSNEDQIFYDVNFAWFELSIYFLNRFIENISHK